MKEVNQPITESEILKNIQTLKNNKSPGSDNIVNEHIKTTIHIFMPIHVYVKLFNLIFDTGIIPDSSTIGVIKPIYKSKGETKNPRKLSSNYIIKLFRKTFYFDFK